MEREGWKERQRDRQTHTVKQTDSEKVNHTEHIISREDHPGNFPHDLLLAPPSLLPLPSLAMPTYTTAP